MINVVNVTPAKQQHVQQSLHLVSPCQWLPVFTSQCMMQMEYE